MNKVVQFFRGLLHCVVFVLLTLADPNESFAQCGQVSTYKPRVANSTVCSGGTGYVFASGLPVTKWIYRDNNAGVWTDIASSSQDNINMVLTTSTGITVRTFRAIISTAECNSDTTDGVDINITQITFGNNNSIKLSSSRYTTCAGGSVRIGIMNFIYTPTQWLYRDNGGAWTSFSNATTAYVSNVLPVSSTKVVRDFRVIVQRAGTCVQDSSDIISVTINPSIEGNNNGVKPFSTTTTVCGGTSVSLNLEWPYEVGNWLYRDGGVGAWQVFSAGATTALDNATSVSTSTVRSYRVLLNNVANCTSDTSDSWNIPINPMGRRILSEIVPRINGNVTSICAGTSVNVILTGFSNLTWSYRDSSTGAWTAFGNASASNILTSPASITKDLMREVRVVINNASNFCSIDTTGVLTYTIRAYTNGNNSAIIPSVASTERSVNSTVTVFAGKDATVSGWCMKDQNQNIWSYTSGGNTLIDNNTAFTSNTSRSYRALLNNTAFCSVDTSAEVKVQFKLPKAGTIIPVSPKLSKYNYCGGSIINATMPLDSGKVINKWMFKDNNASVWTAILNQTGSILYDTNTWVSAKTTRTYLAIVQDLEKNQLDSSWTAQVVIQPTLNGSISAMPYSSRESVCNTNKVAVNFILPAEYSIITWLKRDNGNQSWDKMNISNSSINDSVVTSASGRAYRLLLLNANDCKADTTSALTIRVNQMTGQYLNNVAPVSNLPLICGGTALALSVYPPNGGLISSWQSRDNASAWKTIAATSNNYSEPALNTRVLNKTNREYRIVLNNLNTCTIDTSASLSVSISPYVGGLTTALQPRVSQGYVCAGSASSVSVAGFSGVVQKWLYRDNGGNWTEIGGTVGSNSVNDNNTFVSSSIQRDYRVYIIRTGSCIVDTSQNVSVTIKPYTNGNANGVFPISSVSSVCSGVSYTVSVANYSGIGNKWIYRVNNTGDWRETENAGSTPSYVESNTNVPVNTIRSYRYILGGPGCSLDTTAQVSVSINARTSNSISSVTPTSTSLQLCSGASINLTLNGTLPSGTSVRRWLYQDNGGFWTEIGSSANNTLTHANTSVSTQTTRAYRVIINNNGACTYDSSGVFTIAINPVKRGNVYSTPTTTTPSVCNLTSTPTASFVTANGTFVKWLMNTNGTGWVDFPYATASNAVTDYTLNNSLTANRAYRALINNSATCSIDSTLSVSVSINATAYGTLSGVVPTAASSSVCYSQSASVSVNVPSGYTVSKWMYKDNSGNWQDFKNATSSALLIDNNTLLNTQTIRTYRALFSQLTYCRIDSSAAITITIKPRGNLNAYTTLIPSSASSSICSGKSLSLSLNPPQGSEINNWIYSDNGNNGPWNTAVNASGKSNYIHQGTQVQSTLNRIYKAIITDTLTCALDTTGGISVGINALTNKNNKSIVINGPDSSCMGSSIKLNYNSNTLYTTIGWLYSINGDAFQPFTGNNTDTFYTDFNTQLPIGTNIVYKAILLNATACSIDTISKNTPVYIKQKIYSNSGTTVFIAGADTLCAGSQAIVYSGGTVESWLYSDDNINWNVIPKSSGSPLTHDATLVNKSGWRYYKAIHNNISCVGDSSLIDSVYLKVYGGGISTVIPTVNSTSICASSTNSISVPATAGAVIKWMYRDNGGKWQDYFGLTGLSFTENNTFVTVPTTRDYKVVNQRNCGFDTSGFVSVLISPKTFGSDLTKVPSAGSTSICSGDAVANLTISGITSSTIVQWLYRDNGGAWSQFTGYNSTSLSDINTQVSSITTRDYAVQFNNASACHFDTTAKVSVTIKPIVRGNSVRVPVVNSTACIGNMYTISSSVTSDTAVYKWFYSSNGNWIDRGYITPVSTSSFSEMAYTYSGSASWRALYYKTSTCKMDTSAPATVNFQSKVFGSDTTITPTGITPICALATSNQASVTVGTGNSMNRWLYRDNGGAWNIINTTSTTYAGSVNTQTVINREFRAIINKGVGCRVDTTNALNIVINPAVYASDTSQKVLVASPKNLCAGTSTTVTALILNATVNKWLYRNLNSQSWNVLNAPNSVTITENNTNITSNRVYSYLAYKAASCSIDTSFTDTLFVGGRTAGVDTSLKITSLNLSICSGSSVALQTSGIGSNTIQQWLYSDNLGTSWNVMSTTTATSFTDYNTDLKQTTNRLYRLIVKKATSCTLDSSDILMVGIRARANVSDTSIHPVALSNAICSGNMSSVSIQGLTGRTIYKWIVSNNGGPWSDFAITSATSINDNNTFTSSQTSRKYAAIMVSSFSCTLDTSDVAEVIINRSGYGNNNAIVPGATQNNICSGGIIRMGVNNLGGAKIIKWMFKDKDSDPWTDFGSNSDSITDLSTTTTVQIMRRYRLLLANVSGCSIDSSGIGLMVINPNTRGNINTVVQSVGSNVCTGNPVTLSVTPPSGYIVEQWLSKTGAGAWKSFTGSVSNAVSDTNTTLPVNVVRSYSVRLKNTGGCNTDTSAITTVNITTITRGTKNTFVPTSPNSTICGGTVANISLFGFTGVIKNWLVKDSLGAPWKVVNQTNYIYTDTATTVPVLRVREYGVILYDASNCRYDTTGTFKLTITPNLATNAKSIIPTSAKSAYCSGSEIIVNATGFINGGKITGWIYSDKNGPWNTILQSDSETIHHKLNAVSSLTSRRYRALVYTGCSTDTTGTLTISIDVVPYKPIVLRKIGTDTLLSSETATSYQWKFNGTSISGATQNMYVAKQNGYYQVEISNTSNCKNQSDSLNVTHVGVFEWGGNNQVMVYPNPANEGSVKIMFDLQSQQNVRVLVKDMLGKIVKQYQWSVNHDTQEMDITTLPDGVYILNMETEGKSMMTRLVISKK